MYRQGKTTRPPNQSRHKPKGVNLFALKAVSVPFIGQRGQLATNGQAVTYQDSWNWGSVTTTATSVAAHSGCGCPCDHHDTDHAFERVRRSRVSWSTAVLSSDLVNLVSAYLHCHDRA